MPPIERFTPLTPHWPSLPTVSVVVPAMNEAENLPHVFATLPHWIDEIVLVDGNSADDTVAVARRLRPNVRVVTQTGKGKGNALAAGFAACTGDIIVMIDADGSTDGREIIQFVGALVTGADFVKGSRYAAGGGSDDLTFSRRFGNKVAAPRWSTGCTAPSYTDLCYGYNAFWARHLDVARPRLRRLRGRDPDEHPRRQGRAARCTRCQPRALPDPRREQPARRPRRHPGAEDHHPGVAAPARARARPSRPPPRPTADQGVAHEP